LIEGSMSQQDRTERRRVDRRRQPVGSPPFLTANGLVPIERRARVDRRFSWFRELVLDFDGA
jgi:hypothetical protein